MRGRVPVLLTAFALCLGVSEGSRRGIGAFQQPTPPSSATTRLIPVWRRLRADNEAGGARAVAPLAALRRQVPQPRGKEEAAVKSDGGENVWAEEFAWPNIVKRCGDSVTRVLALKVWLVFVWFTFLSPYAPGPVPNPVDPAILQQVGGLTLNYFCVLPTVLPKLAPVFSPVMEGVFNLLLSWSILFSGFLVDGRKKGWSTNVFLPFMAAAVVLTNTAYLPWVVLRPQHSPDGSDAPTLEDVPKVERQLGESKTLLGLYGAAGIYSGLWCFFGRPEFGGLTERMASFNSLMSTDRLMFAFTAELVLFALFQGVMVDDDLRRRGVDPSTSRIGPIAKVVPFFGLIAYFLLRPPLPGEPRDD